MNKIVEIKKIDFSYAEDLIFKDLNLDINENDFNVIVGENGIGKSTLLKLILGENKAQKGIVNLFGDNIEKNNHYKDIAYISQNAYMEYKNFPTTVEETIKIHLRFLKNKIDVDKYLKFVKLENHSTKKLSELSGGQLQRVGLLLALIKNAKLIILDEPIAGIDKKFAKEFYKILEKLKQEGKTIIMVTHHLEEIKGYADKIYKVEDLKLKEIKGE